MFFIEERRLTWEKKNICEVRKITKKKGNRIKSTKSAMKRAFHLGQQQKVGSCNEWKACHHRFVTVSKSGIIYGDFFTTTPKTIYKGHWQIRVTLIRF